jgi:hypothetical protein
MNELKCGNFSIPLCFVQSVSWSKRAKTVTHRGGYVSSRGFEPTEISVKLHIDVATCTTFGLSISDIFSRIETTVTDRVSQTGVFYLGGYAVYPTLEFALTNINKTYSCELGIMECDCVWSGCKPVKNVAREDILEVEPVAQIPKVTLSVDGKELVLQDFCSINTFTTTPDSIQISASIGTDLDLVSRSGFLTKLLNGTIQAELPQGTTTYYVIEADLADELLTMTGSVLPPQAAQIVTHTFQDVDISEVIGYLVRSAGVPALCKVFGHIDHYSVFGTPIQCLKDLQQSAGFIMSWRQGGLTFVPVPSALNTNTELEYINMESDTDTEPIHGLYWYDGVNQDQAGVLDSTGIKLQSAFRSSEKWAESCLSLARYNKNAITVQAEILPTLDTHSVVYVRSNDQIISCMAEWLEFDWINNSMTVELHYV